MATGNITTIKHVLRNFMYKWSCPNSQIEEIYDILFSSQITILSKIEGLMNSFKSYHLNDHDCSLGMFD